MPAMNNPSPAPTKNVGGGLLPMAVCQVKYLYLIHRYRGQAPSHIDCIDPE
ncbi:hypothetical protein SAMN04490197_5419 [Pseudomonas orientalis]|uniref:Uncharacterized protein n=1 Tax=Pseudomonas orientalis TaxID=76758 RepID=A0A8B3Y4S5_9PSED|nr:hypothetical protein SAMN04490197_5419 [Pseudomonas orientalis]